MTRTSAFVLIAATIVACGFGRQAVAAPDTSDWQVYRNATYGYEIRYPDEFEARPTGPAGDRDGRAIRIQRKKYSAMAPALSVDVRSTAPCTETLLDFESPDMDTVIGEIEIDASRAQESTSRWKVNGDIAFVTICLGETRFLFQAQPGSRDFRETIWWTIVTTFRLVDD